MHMEAVQRYVINLTEEDGKALLSELSKVPVQNMGDEMINLYELLGIWFGS